MTTAQLPPRRLSCFAAMALVCGLFPLTAGAQVNDGADIFSSQAEKQATQSIDEIKSKYRKTLLIETFKELPADKAAQLPAKSPQKLLQEMVAERNKATPMDGVVFFILMEPKQFDVFIGIKTKQEGLFTDTDRKDMLSEVRAALSDGRNDEALTRTAAFVLNRMNQHRPQAVAGATTNAPVNPAPAAPVGAAARTAEKRDGVGGFSLGTLVCTGLAILGVIMLVRGIMRSRQQQQHPYGPGPYGQGGPGQQGYGQQGYGQPGYGGGGGGFGTGLMGGILGGMAGGWIGNKVFGQSAPPPTDSGSAMGAGQDPSQSGGFDSGAGGSFGDSGQEPSSFDSGFDSGGDGGGFDGGGFDGGGGDF